MLDVKMALAAEAERIASNMQGRIRTLESELPIFSGAKSHLEAELLAAHASCERLTSFHARIGRNYQCPRCWVRDGTNHTVRGGP